jgi:hypothetical protein
VRCLWVFARSLPDECDDSARSGTVVLEDVLFF